MIWPWGHTNWNPILEYRLKIPITGISYYQSKFLFRDSSWHEQYIDAATLRFILFRTQHLTCLRVSKVAGFPADCCLNEVSHLNFWLCSSNTNLVYQHHSLIYSQPEYAFNICCWTFSMKYLLLVIKQHSINLSEETEELPKKKEENDDDLIKSRVKSLETENLTKINTTKTDY